MADSKLSQRRKGRQVEGRFGPLPVHKVKQMSKKCKDNKNWKIAVTCEENKIHQSSLLVRYMNTLI
jgi:hypothetical protein